MVAGLNVRFNIWSMDTTDDDIVGGAQITGSCIYQDVYGRFQANPDQQLLLQQGLETVRTYSANIVPGTLSMKERDEVEISAPTDHPYYQDRFRIMSMRWSDHNPRDPRNYIMLTLTRSVQAHAEQ